VEVVVGADGPHRVERRHRAALVRLRRGGVVVGALGVRLAARLLVAAARLEVAELRAVVALVRVVDLAVVEDAARVGRVRVAGPAQHGGDRGRRAEREGRKGDREGGYGRELGGGAAHVPVETSSKEKNSQPRVDAQRSWHSLGVVIAASIAVGGGVGALEYSL
jgi:hypothetical protein